MTTRQDLRIGAEPIAKPRSWTRSSLTEPDRSGGFRISIRGRFRTWWMARLPRVDTVLLTQRNIYILPTRAGMMFAATLLVLLLSSINYQLSLGFVLTFLLAGSGVVSMYVTHNTLRGLTLHMRPPPPAFATEPAGLDVTVISPGRPRYGIGLRLETATPADLSWIDVPAGGQATARLSFVPPRRGLHGVPTVLAETRFPLGLFRAWTVWRPAAELLAWPAPERPAAPLPSASGAHAGEVATQRTQGGETEGVRAYRRGDPMRLVVWKKVARAGEMVSRDTTAAVHQRLWLDYQASGAADVESRLSRLAAWVIAADRSGAAYGLKLPGLELPLATGEGQRRACLDALATWRL